MSTNDVNQKNREGNQYGSSGADYICRLSGTVQDRGAVPGLFIPAAVSERVCVPILRCERILSHLPPEPVPVQEVPQADFRDRRNRNVPHASFSGAVVLGDLSLCKRQAGYLCVPVVQNAGNRVRKCLVFAETNPQSLGTAGRQLPTFRVDGGGRRFFGGRKPGKRGRGTAQKKVVIVLSEVSGKGIPMYLRMQEVPDLKRKTL